MRLLVLGGSSFVGRALVEDGAARGWSVTTFNRGRSAWAHPDAEHLIGDRDAPATLEAALGGREFDVVADTWAGAPRAARASARLLAGRAGHYAYISTCNVYAEPYPLGVTEEDPLIDADPDEGDSDDYGRRKRGAEIAIGEAFGDRATFLRAGLIVGPHEDVGRLPAWLLRLARGGDVLAPGPADQPLQFIDARDLAAFTLDRAAEGRGGAYNMVARRGHATMRSLLEACRAVTGAGARLVWVTPELIAEQGIEPWTELPLWLPPGHEAAGLLAIGVEKAYAAGLLPRPAQETIRDTWAWLASLSAAPPTRPDLPPHGLDPERERAALFAMRTG
jgi:2'-hydroxyisoflavone reductase